MYLFQPPCVVTIHLGSGPHFVIFDQKLALSTFPLHYTCCQPTVVRPSDVVERTTVASLQQLSVLL